MADRRRVRPDPCTLVHEVVRRDPDEGPAEVAARAIDLWTHLARREGWDVQTSPLEEEPRDTVATAVTVVGAVDVEGIRYAVHLGPRKRMPVVDATSGTIVDRVVLKRSVWVEPVLTGDLLATYP